MKVISFKICPFVQRVTALLEAKNLPYEVEFISLSNKPQWFLDISPNGQVPVLVTDSGRALFESDAIVEYIEEAYPPLESDISLEDKAINRAWSYLATKNYLVQCSAQSSADAATLAQRSEKLEKAFDRMEKQLGDSRFFSSDTIGMVDIAWLTLLHRADIIQRRSCYDFIGDRPKMKRWQREILATELPNKSVADDFEEVFANFYLSDKTLLGRCNIVATAATAATVAGVGGESVCCEASQCEAPPCEALPCEISHCEIPSREISATGSCC